MHGLQECEDALVIFAPEHTWTNQKARRTVDSGGWSVDDPEPYSCDECQHGPRFILQFTLDPEQTPANYVTQERHVKEHLRLVERLRKRQK